MRSTSSLGSDIRNALTSIRDAVSSSDIGRFARTMASDASHGDLRASILTAVADEPKNGHQIMQSIGEASNGEWMPAASHVYPLLAQLTDEGLLSSKVKGERTTYTLTDAGREALASTADADTATSANHGSASKVMRDWKMPKWDDANAAVPKAGAKLAQAAAQVAQSGSRDQKERAAALLDETRRKLYAILAED